MLELILIIFPAILLIVSLVKPDAFLTKEMKEKVNEEQKKVLATSYRKMYSIIAGLIWSVILENYLSIGLILAIVFIILFLKVALPAKKEISKITKELNQ